MKKTIVASLFVATLSVAAVVALAGFRGRCGPHGATDPAKLGAMVSERLDEALDALDATPAQRTAILALKDPLLAQVVALHASREATHQAFLAEWNASNPDRNKIHALIDQRAAEMTALAHQAADAAIQAHDQLTPEQRSKAAARLERRHR